MAWLESSTVDSRTVVSPSANITNGPTPMRYTRPLADQLATTVSCHEANHATTSAVMAPAATDATSRRIAGRVPPDSTSMPGTSALTGQPSRRRTPSRSLGDGEPLGEPAGEIRLLLDLLHDPPPVRGAG